MNFFFRDVGTRAGGIDPLEAFESIGDFFGIGGGDVRRRQDQRGRRGAPAIAVRRVLRK